MRRGFALPGLVRAPRASFAWGAVLGCIARFRASSVLSRNGTAHCPVMGLVRPRGGYVCLRHQSPLDQRRQASVGRREGGEHRTGPAKGDPANPAKSMEGKLQALVSCPLVEEGPAVHNCAAPRNLPPITRARPTGHAARKPPSFFAPVLACCVAFGGPAFATELTPQNPPPVTHVTPNRSSLVINRAPHFPSPHRHCPTWLPSPSSLTMTIFDGPRASSSVSASPPDYFY